MRILDAKSAGATAPLGGLPRPDVAALEPLDSGEWIDGKYRVERTLAQGGMGVVVEAVHALLGKRVAVKLLRPEVAEDEDALRRFVNEARIAAQLPGDHIARAIDFGRTDDGEAYLVMELLVGRDLEAELRARRRFSVPDAVDTILQACEGLAEAHAVGLVHRDLKPANLFLTRRRDGSELVKVLDFGISKWSLGPAATAVTMRTTGCGTPAYMAPEQFEPFVRVDARCDQHALAAVLFELVAGRRAFTAETLCALSMQIASQPPPRLREHCPGAPPGLEAAIVRALAKRREDRFPDLACFARAIAPFGGPGAAASARNVARVLEGAPPSRRAAPRAAEETGDPARTGPRRVVVPPVPRRAAIARAEETPPVQIAGAAVGALLVSAALIAGIGGIGLLLEPPAPRPEAAQGLAAAARRAAAQALIPPPTPPPPPEAVGQSPEPAPPRPPPARYGAGQAARPNQRPAAPTIQRPPARTPRAVFGGR